MIKNILWKNKLNHWEYDLEKLITYVENESSKYAGKEGLCKALGVYRDFLDRLELKHNIKINYNFKLGKTNPNYKAIYQDYDWCYQKYMVEGLNHYEMAKEANCSKRVIEKWCTEKHKLNQQYRRKHKELSNKQKDLVIGSLLGDGHIDKRETQPIFIVSHAENQKDYLFWKYEIMKDFLNIPPTYYKESTRIFQTNKSYWCQPFYRISSRIHDCFIPYRNMTKNDLIKNLNDFSLSIFSLDDGCRSNQWELCLADISLEDRYFFIKTMKEKFNLNGYILNHDNRYMKFTSDSSRKLDNIILDNVPSNLDIIQYKIINNSDIQKEQFRLYIKYKNEDILLKDFCKLFKYDYKFIHYALNKYNLLNGEGIINFMKSREVKANAK